MLSSLQAWTGRITGGQGCADDLRHASAHWILDMKGTPHLRTTASKTQEPALWLSGGMRC